MPIAPLQRCVRFTLGFAFCGVLGAFAGCDRDHSALAMSTEPIRTATAQEPVSGEDTGRGQGYQFHIRYPDLQPESQVLARAMRDFTAGQKRDFFAALDPATRNSDAPEYVLDLSFDVARHTAAFVSVLANGSAFTGGAHANPIVATFNLHSEDSRLVGISDLFSNPDEALKAISEESRRQLEGRFEATLREQVGDKALPPLLKSMREWVERGTEPRAESFAVFLVDGLDAPAIGLTLIFPAYQVAASSEGEQQVEIPAKVFYALLKPEFRDAFAIDTEAEKTSGSR